MYNIFILNHFLLLVLSLSLSNTQQTYSEARVLHLAPLTRVHAQSQQRRRPTEWLQPVII